MDSAHPTCKTCGYYRQHYIWCNGFMRINHGHCVHPPRVRQCRPNMSACEKWIEQDTGYRDTYVFQQEY